MIFKDLFLLLKYVIYYNLVLVNYLILKYLFCFLLKFKFYNIYSIFIKI